MKFEVKNRFSGEVQFTAEIECAEDAHVSIKLGLAVKWAIKVGANLADANLARADLAGANLADANLAGANLADANLARADLAGANLADANLARAYLARANLADAYLARTYLAGADLARANLARADLAGALKIDEADIPIIPNIDATILKAIEAGGKLDMRQWHGDEACGTTHCRAGWAVHLAGEKGYQLENRVGPQMAGTLIYQASRPGKPAPHFFATNERALEDLRRCAAETAPTQEPQQ